MIRIWIAAIGFGLFSCEGTSSQKSIEENVQELYPEVVFVEFYLLPSEEDGLDWKVLILL